MDSSLDCVSTDFISRLPPWEWVCEALKGVSVASHLFLAAKPPKTDGARQRGVR